jgi:hypothetical protein
MDAAQPATRSWEEIERAMEARASRPLADRVALAGPWRVNAGRPVLMSDGYAWSGAITKAGRKVGWAEDGGYGGAVLVRFDGPGRDALEAEFLAAARAFDPECDFEQAGTFASQLADLNDEVKRLRRACKTKLVFRRAGDPGGEWRTLAVLFAPERAAALRAKYPDVVEIANEVIVAY